MFCFLLLSQVPSRCISQLINQYLAPRDSHFSVHQNNPLKHPEYFHPRSLPYNRVSNRLKGRFPNQASNLSSILHSSRLSDHLESRAGNQFVIQATNPPNSLG
jgi:hypothetical protein